MQATPIHYVEPNDNKRGEEIVPGDVTLSASKCTIRLQKTKPVRTNRAGINQDKEVPMKKKRWIFLGGLVITAVIGFSVVSHAGHYFSSPMGLGHMYRLNLLSEELGLTTDHRAALKEIVLEQQKAFQSLHREFRPRLDTQLEKTRKELARVLTPEQA
jgi:Spy/CpxP family protein refolding chaperone